MQPHQTYEYLVKARERLFDWIRPLSPEQYAREFPYGLKTIHATLTHTASAEWAYGRRIRGAVAAPPESPFAADKVKTFADLESKWKALAGETRSVLAGITSWSDPVEYRMALPNQPPMRIRTTRDGIAAQLLFHEVHHRAQVMSMLRQLGVAAQNLDYSALIFDRQPESA
jgi:uncharacterized damage-inducible protein DinB